MKNILLFWETDKLIIWLVRSFYIIKFFENEDFWWRNLSAWKDLLSYSPVFGMGNGYLLF